MDSTEQQKLIPLAHAAELLLSRMGRKPSRRTLRRWAVEGRDGRTLRVIRLGPGWWTRPEWVHDFIDSFMRPRRTRPVGTQKVRVQRALDLLRQQGIKLE